MQHPKGVLIEHCKQSGLAKPKFDTKNTGPEHEPTFVSDVLIQGEVYGKGEGNNKREAERKASEAALSKLRNGAGSVSNGLQNGAVSARGKRKPQPAPAASEGEKAANAPEEATPSDAPFEGPWPIFPEVLASSLAVANSRVDSALRNGEAISAVQDLALDLYKSSLEHLGEVIEVEE